MDVLFAVLPFADVASPALGVSLLEARLDQMGIDTHIRYYNLDLAEWLGLGPYYTLADADSPTGAATAPPAQSLVGEWFFSELVFGRHSEGDAEYLERFVQGRPQVERRLPELLAARRELGTLVDRWVEDIRELNPSIVGFTTMFYQTCACLAVARRLKETGSSSTVVFGGSNCAGTMGRQMLASFPWIDAVCTGDGDEVFPRFVEHQLGGETVPIVPGMVTRHGDNRGTRPPLVHALDTLPFPDYGDYFARLADSPLADDLEIKLFVETARGCWWGEKHHCTFCGLNAETMAFRAKSPDRVLAELSHLVTRYGVRRIDCTDNILHPDYLTTLFPRLAASDLEVELFYETKANLRYDQLYTMRRGGVWKVQPGIESFSNDVLRLMRKGCTGLQNIQTLRWCTELDLEVIWNVIFGFPGEDPADYAAMADLLPLLTHLRPPTFASKIRLDRFSPHFTEADTFGFVRIRPTEAYRHVFRLPADQLANLAYFFEFDYADGRKPETYAAPLHRAVHDWWEGYEAKRGDRPRLDLYQSGGVVIIDDTRPCRMRRTHFLTGLDAAIYTRCDVAQTPASLARALPHATPRGIDASLTRLCASKLTVRMGGKYLSLALFRTRPAPRLSAAATTAVTAPDPTSIDRPAAEVTAGWDITVVGRPQPIVQNGDDLGAASIADST